MRLGQENEAVGRLILPPLAKYTLRVYCMAASVLCSRPHGLAHYGCSVNELIDEWVNAEIEEAWPLCSTSSESSERDRCVNNPIMHEVVKACMTQGRKREEEGNLILFEDVEGQAEHQFFKNKG